MAASAPRPVPRSAPLAVLLAALFLPAATLANTAVYRTVDENGIAHYGDRGLPNAQRLPVRLPPPNPTALADLEVVRNGAGSDVYVINRLGGPIEVNVLLSEAANVNALPSLPLRQMLPANKRVLVSRIESANGGSMGSYSVGMKAMPGDPTAMPDKTVYALPVDDSGNWHLGQAFHGGFSHTDEQNLYAVDLVVDEGTPVLAARGGVVMQVESAFDRSGLNRDKYAERANLVRIVHDDGTMAVYAHLKENGVYVRVGQRVELGQQIAASGNTGYSTGPHLHFSLQVNRGMKLVSIPFRMVSGSGFLNLPSATTRRP